jgi:hypothetical protein
MKERDIKLDITNKIISNFVLKFVDFIKKLLEEKNCHFFSNKNNSPHLE